MTRWVLVGGHCDRALQEQKQRGASTLHLHMTNWRSVWWSSMTAAKRGSGWGHTADRGFLGPINHVALVWSLDFVPSAMTVS